MQTGGVLVGALRGVEDAVGEELDAVVEQRPEDGVAPDEAGPAPAEGGHEQPLDGDQGREDLGAQDDHPEDAGGSNRPERSASAGQEDGQVPRDGQLQVHQGLDVVAVEVEDELTEVEEPEGGDDDGDSEDRGDA